MTSTSNAFIISLQGNLIHLKESERYPHFLMSFDILEPMKFSGSVLFGSSPGRGVFGMVFNYVTNRRFNVLKWSSEGLELWLVNIIDPIRGSKQAKKTTTSYSIDDISDCLKPAGGCDSQVGTYAYLYECMYV